MKLSLIPSVSLGLERIRASDSEKNPSNHEERRQQDDDNGKDESEAFEDVLQDTPVASKEVSLGDALGDFAKEPRALAYGLNASAVGVGPGLRVTLKDGQGAVVRQFTGEEFLKLRESASMSGRGRLIDKKL